MELLLHVRTGGYLGVYVPASMKAISLTHSHATLHPVSSEPPIRVVKNTPAKQKPCTGFHTSSAVSMSLSVLGLCLSCTKTGPAGLANCSGHPGLPCY